MICFLPKFFKLFTFKSICIYTPHCQNCIIYFYNLTLFRRAQVVEKMFTSVVYRKR